MREEWQGEGVASARAGERSRGAVSAWWSRGGAVAACIVALGACGEEGPAGPQGLPGAPGERGSDGTSGTSGSDGANGSDGGAGEPDSDASAAGPTSGTRIKLTKQRVTTTTTTTDGARSVTTYEEAGWFDSQRNEPCSFQLAADGKTRCLPAELARWDYSGGNYFLDAACTQRIALSFKVSTVQCGASTSPPPPTASYLFAATTADNGCSGATVRLIGATVTPAMVYLKSGANCLGLASSPDVYDYLLPGAEIAPGEFVEQTTTIVRQ